ncbi:hypothetical protein [Streptomyces sp. NPDC059957]
MAGALLVRRRGVAVKPRWGLAVDQEVREALLAYTANCPDVNLIFERAS